MSMLDAVDVGVGILLLAVVAVEMVLFYLSGR